MKSCQKRNRKRKAACLDEEQHQHVGEAVGERPHLSGVPPPGVKTLGGDVEQGVPVGQHQHVEEGPHLPGVPLSGVKTLGGDFEQGVSVGQHQHVEGPHLSGVPPPGVKTLGGDVKQGVAVGQHQRVGEGPDLPGVALPSVKTLECPDQTVIVERGLATSSRKSKRAVPCLSGLTKGLAMNKKNKQAVPTPNPKTSGSVTGNMRMKKRKDTDYNLNCWNLWWKRMEREGLKEMVDRKVMGMQRSARTFMNTNCDRNISTIGNMILTHTRTEEHVPELNYLNVTPKKRKCDLRTDPGLFQTQSVTESPAKRHRSNFNYLVKYWDNTTQLMNTPQQNLKKTIFNYTQINAQDQKMPKSANYPVGDELGESESGC